MDVATLRWRIDALGRSAFVCGAAEFDGLDLLVMGCCTADAHLVPRRVALLQAVAWMREGNGLHGADGLRRDANNASFDIAQRVLLGDRCLSRAFMTLVGIGSAAVLREFADAAVAIVEEDIVELGRPRSAGDSVSVSLRGALAAGVTMLEGGEQVSITAARRLALGLEALCRDGGSISRDTEATLQTLLRRSYRRADGALFDAIVALLALLRERR